MTRSPGSEKSTTDGGAERRGTPHAREEALQEMVPQKNYGSKLVSGFTDRRPPLEQTVHYEGEYQPDTSVMTPPKRTQYVKKGINPEDL